MGRIHGNTPRNAPANMPLTTKRKSLVWSKAPLNALTVPRRRAMGPSAKSVTSATSQAINAQTAESVWPLAMKNANGRTRSKRMAVSALAFFMARGHTDSARSEDTSELQSQFHLVCRLLLEKKKKNKQNTTKTIK